jgi:hypothetical protein
MTLCLLEKVHIADCQSCSILLNGVPFGLFKLMRDAAALLHSMLLPQDVTCELLAGWPCELATALSSSNGSGDNVLACVDSGTDAQGETTDVRTAPSMALAVAQTQLKWSRKQERWLVKVTTNLRQDRICWIGLHLLRRSSPIANAQPVSSLLAALA